MVKRIKEKLRQVLRNEKGMTLIELIAVIVIIGIIAAIAIPVVTGQIEKSKEGTAVQNLSILQNALERYAQDNNGKYPVIASGKTLADYLTPTYVQVIPANPWGYSGGLSYSSTDGSSYSLEYDSDSSKTHTATASNTAAATAK